jgi:hypothetical protein
LERQLSTVTTTAGVIALHDAQLGDVVLSAFTPKIKGDKIGERFHTSDSMRAGFEPAYSMYSTPAFAITSKGRQEIVETLFISK